jgi:hypothetical protein
MHDVAKLNKVMVENCVFHPNFKGFMDDDV